MATMTIRPGKPLQGVTAVPGDKSISHRALMLGALADGKSQVRGWLPAGDTLATLDCIQKLGVEVIRHDDTTLTIAGGGLRQPQQVLNCVNAGTGIRLLAGLLAGQNFESVLDGSDQLRRRPMRRVTEPLRQMGANITDTEGRAPLTIKPGKLHGIAFEQPVASAQVKSALLFAGLYADSPTTVIEPGAGRDHSERMLRAMGVPIHVEGSRITLEPCTQLHTLGDFVIPGDFSSAAFLIAAAALVENSAVTLTGVNTNDRRTGLLDVMVQEMGLQVRVENERLEGGEPVADITIYPSSLRATTVGGEVVVKMIDEFPVFMVLATQIPGTTLVKDAAELRVKETDRIAVMAGELRKMGAEITELPDGFSVEGVQKLRGAVVDSHDDHRIGMSLAVAALVAEGETTILDAACVHDSFPGFENVLQQLGVDLTWQN